MRIRNAQQKHQIMEKDFEKILESADSSQVLNAILKVTRRKNAETFIDLLPQKFTESQRENFINVLCDYESFIDKINNKF